MTRNFRRLTFSVKQFCELHDNFFYLNVGALFAAVATLETICTLFGAAIFNSIYPLFLRVGLNGFSFLVMAFLMIAALILTEWVQCSLFWFVFHCFRFSGSRRLKEMTYLLTYLLTSRAKWMLARTKRGLLELRVRHVEIRHSGSLVVS